MTKLLNAATKGKKKTARWWLGEKPGKQGILVRQRVGEPEAEEIARKLQERDREKFEIGTFNKLEKVKASGEHRQYLEDKIFNHRASIEAERRGIEYIQETLETIKQKDPEYYPLALERKSGDVEKREKSIEEHEREIKRLERKLGFV
jgi:hypothetical protein